MGEGGELAIPIVVFVATFGGGVIITRRWLPRLAGGRVHLAAFWIVCGLVGAATGAVGLDVYETVRRMEQGGLKLLYNGNGNVLASGLSGALFDGGTLLGFAAIVYFLAAKSRRDELADSPLG
jgi:hypothetical protein